jgi:hypothetical protein
LSLPQARTPGTIFTVAGDSSSGFSGDGGLAANAQLNAPWGVTADSFGNLYIADTGNHVIRKIDTIGMISTVAGQAGNSNFGGDGGPATSAQLEDPISVFNGRCRESVYRGADDRFNWRIRQWSSNQKSR